MPIFPAGVTEINRNIAVQKEAGHVWYIHGHLPVFHHDDEDVRSFRMFSSQMILNGTVKPKEIVKVFGVPSITVKRYVKLFREQGVQTSGHGQVRDDTFLRPKCRVPGLD